MSLTPTERSPYSAAVLIAAAGLSAWLWATAVGNLPMRDFERIREHRGPIRIWMPGWRFFSPNPDGYDLALLYRVRTPSGEVSEWDEIDPPPERTWRHAFIYPAKRNSKTMQYALQQLLGDSRRVPRRALPQTRWHQAVEAHVRRHGLAAWADRGLLGVQFAVVKHAGFDNGPALQYHLVSPFLPVPA